MTLTKKRVSTWHIGQRQGSQGRTRWRGGWQGGWGRRYSKPGVNFEVIGIDTKVMMVIIRRRKMVEVCDTFISLHIIVRRRRRRSYWNKSNKIIIFFQNIWWRITLFKCCWLLSTWWSPHEYGGVVRDFVPPRNGDQTSAAQYSEPAWRRCSLKFRFPH